MSVDLGNRGARAELRQELVRRPVDVARAEQQDEVTRADSLEKDVGEPLPAAHEAHVEVSAALERLEERLARDTGHWAFARGIDLGEHQQVGVVEGPEEVVEEIARAREAMRLERHHQSAAEALAGGAQRGPDLLGMMAVVVYHQDA